MVEVSAASVVVGVMVAMGEATEPPRHIVDSDEKRLNELGYKQEYKRVMSPFQQWAYTFSYTAPLGFITGIHTYT